jgi:diguanylate cyclase (GGDEF)-like protein
VNRTQISALTSGLARRVALVGVACATLLLLAAAVVISRDAQRNEAATSRQLTAERATQSARAVSARLEAATLVLQSRPAPAIATERGPMFGWSALLPLEDGNALRDSKHLVQLTPAERVALVAGQALVVEGFSPKGRAIFLLKPQSGGEIVRVAELAPDYLWAPDEQSNGAGAGGLWILDSRGEALAGGPSLPAGMQAMFASSWRDASPQGGAIEMAWQARGASWLGSLVAIPASGGTALHPLAMVSGVAERPWSAHFGEALLSLLPVFVLAVALSLCAAALVAQRYVPGLRRLQRALLRLADSQVRMPRMTGAVRELDLVIDAFNQTAARIERQRESLRSLSGIDALLIGAGDVESVMDEVLALVREVMLARNVGMTLVDANAPTHGRLFCVSAESGAPVTRVNLDPQMVETLGASRTGMTIFRFEEQRHSFLTPLHAGGSQFFWVWPVCVGDRLAAILSVGYTEPPQAAEQIARCGTECAQRLAASLASSARAEQLYRQAHFDPLTQLPNRLLFRDRLAQELTAASDGLSRGALLYVDLDNFKRVNDSFGHEAGDQLLAIVAQRLRSCVKDGDTVARLGGDEFTIILRQVTDGGSVSAVADRIQQSLQMPVSIAGRDHHVRASIGISMFPDDGATPDGLLHNADLAMYQAKAGGRGTAAFFERRLAERGAQVADSGLYRALKRREFAVYYQPQFAVGDGRLLGVEALVRWQTPRDGLRTPAEFIPAAEESGLIVDLGSWVLDSVCAQYSQWRAEGIDVPRVAVNVSPRQLRDPSFVGTVRRVLDRHQMPPDLLDIELTEAALVDPESQQAVAALGAMGIGLTLDDFGTGHAALNNLRRYPVRAVKIDRSFVEEVAANYSVAALAGTIIVMAHALDKLVVAEGIETLEQLDFFRERGCDIAQGYYLARPVPAMELTAMLRGQRANAEADAEGGAQSAQAAQA